MHMNKSFLRTKTIVATKELPGKHLAPLTCSHPSPNPHPFQSLTFFVVLVVQAYMINNEGEEEGKTPHSQPLELGVAEVRALTYTPSHTLFTLTHFTLTPSPSPPLRESWYKSGGREWLRVLAGIGRTSRRLSSLLPFQVTIGLLGGGW